MAIPTSSNNLSYLSGFSVDMLPFVSAEWNYNLVYGPYATFTGLTTVDTSTLTNDTTNPSNWSITSGYVACSRVLTGKVTSVFKNNNATQFLVSPTGSYTDTKNFTGSTTMSINVTTPTTPLSKKSYKIVFYAKSIDNNIINLVSQATNSKGTLAGTTSSVIDNVDWKRIELKAGFNLSDATDPGYSNFNLTLDFTNNTLSSINPWGLIISNVRIYEISYFDYLYGSLYNTDDVFTYFRPGESYVTSGNNQVPDVVRNSSYVPSGWNSNLPCSSVTYSPKVLFNNPQSPLYKNGVLTAFSRYKYYVSENAIGQQTSIGAAYADRLATNKIVIKLNISQSIPNSLTIALWDNATNAVAPVSLFTLNATDIALTNLSSSGEMTLYWQGAGNGFYGSGWGATKWNWSPTDTSGMPFIDNTGNIAMYVNGTSVNGYQYIDKITLTQGSATPISNYQSAYAAGTIKPNAYQELQRFQVIEISPRLEIDLSSYVLSVDIIKTLDDKGTPLPISSMSSNSANVEFSNIPLTGQNTLQGIPAALSLFSTNANTPVQMTSNFSTISPLTGTLVKNVKLYINYYLPTQSNSIIPAGIFYVDTWDNQDLSTTKANCYDIMKFLQTVPVADYVSKSQSLTNVVTNILDFAGFTDYDYDSLVNLTTDNNQKISTGFYYADSASKTVYSILKETFLAYQISSWIDEYGIMRFKTLQSILTNNLVNWNVDDFSIVLDSYNENIKTKLGKVLLRYRAPQIRRTVGLSNPNKASSILQVAPDIIWQESTDDLVTFNLLKDSIPTLSQNFYTTDPGSFDSLFFTNNINHSGYCIVENEIMSSGNMEFLLTGQKQDPVTGAYVNIGQSKTVYPSSDNELTYALAQFSNSTNATNVIQKPTGRYVNVQRGLFGSQAKNHTVMVSPADFDAVFSSYQMSANSSTLNGPLSPMAISQNIIQVPVVGSGTKSLVIPKNGTDQGYSTYSAKFKLPTAPADVSAGIFFNMTGLSGLSGQTYFIELRSQGPDVIYKKYTLNFYQVSSSGTLTQLIKTQNVSNYLWGDFDNEPDDGLFNAELGNYINLKFVNSPNKRVIYLNKHRILLDQIIPNNPKYTQKWLNPNTSVISGTAGTNFGFFTSSPTATTSTVKLQEIYATQTPIDEPVNYYFQTKKFLNSLIQNQNIKEKSYFVQSRPQIIGLNFYDVQLSPTPSLGAEFFKSSYSYYYFPNNIDPNVTVRNQKSIQPKLVRVKEDAIGYSDVTSTGFRARFALVNASPYAVYTKTNTSSSQLVNAELRLASRGFITLTPQLTAERTFDLKNVNEIIELQSDWIQDKKTAEDILKVIAQGADPFSKDISVEIFGNPLIQIGDVVNLNYSLKNISNITFVVTAVEQMFQSGLTTKITMNQITYNGVTKANLGIVYPAGSNQGNAPTITSIQDTTLTTYNKIDNGIGKTQGNAGDSVTILGTGFGSDSLVFFGKNSATITANSATSLTVIVPNSTVLGPIDVSVVSGGLTGSVYGLFSYLNTVTGVATITNLTSTLGSGAYGLWNANLSWSVTGANYDHYNIVQNGSGSWGTDNSEYTYQLDSGSHAISINNLYADFTYTWTITPIYTDSLGIQYVGNSVTTSPLKMTLSTGGSVGAPTITGTPTIVPRTYYLGSTLVTTYDVTFTYSFGANSDEVYAYESGTSSTNLIGVSTTNSFTFTSLSSGSQTFYLGGGKQGTGNISSTYATWTLDPSKNPGNAGGTPSTAVLPPSVISATPVPAYNGSSLTSTVTFNIQKGTNSDATYVFMDGTSGVNRINGPTANYWTGNTITVSNIPIIAGQSTLHNFYFYGYNTTTLAQSSTGGNDPVHAGALLYPVSVTGAVTGPVVPPSAGQLQPPVISSPSFTAVSTTSGTINATIQFDAVDTPSPSSYTITAVSVPLAPITVSQVASVSGNTTVSLPSVPVGSTYTVSVVAHDVTKTYSDSPATTFSIYSAPDPATFPALTGVFAASAVGAGASAYWTVSGGSAFYDTFQMQYSDSSGVTQNTTITSAGSWVANGTSISTNGINFGDTRFLSGTFTSGSTFTASITGFYLGVAGTTYTATCTIPQTIVVTPPFPYAMTGPTSSHPTAKNAFDWFDVLLSNGTNPTGYTWELYSGQSVNPLNLLSTAFVAYGTATNSTYEVGTSRVSNMLFRVQTNSLAGNSTWSTKLIP
jgi:hypothetical protein